MPTTPSTQRSWSSRLPSRRGVLRAAAIAVLAVALLLLLLAWGVPELLRWQITSRGSELLGRPVTVQKIRFVPWRLETRIRGLAVAAAPAPAAGAGTKPSASSTVASPAAGTARGSTAVTAAEPALQIGSVRFRLALASLWKLAPVVRGLDIEAPSLRVARRADGHYSFDDIVARLTQPDPAKPKPAHQAPPRFSLRDARIEGGAITFDDQGVVRQVRDLNLVLPFIGTLDDAQRTSPVQPRLAFTLDGSHFDSAANALPFAEVRRGELTLRFQALELARWAGYLPASVPVRLAAGTLDGDITLDWSGAGGSQSAGAKAGAGAGAQAGAGPDKGTGETPPTAATAVPLDLRGTLTAHDLQLTDAQGAALASATGIAIEVAHVDVFDRSAHVTRVALTDPVLRIDRSADGTVRGLDGSAKDGPKDGAKSGAKGGPDEATAAPASPSGSANSGAFTPAADASEPGPAKAWQVHLGAFSVQGGAAQFTDAAVETGAAFGISALTVKAGPLAYPFNAAVPFELAADLSATRAGGEAAEPQAARAAHLKAHGRALPKSGDLSVQVTGLPLEWAGPYLAKRLQPTLTGRLAASAQLAWSSAGWKAQLGTAQIDQLQLADAGATVAKVGQLAVKDAVIDGSAHSASVGSLAVVAPEMAIARDAQGHWMFERWLGQGVEQKPGPPWKLALGKLAVSGGAFDFSDEKSARPVKLQTSGVDVTLSGLAWPAAAGKPDSPLDVAFRFGKDKDARGSFAYRGTLGLSPLQLDGKLEVKRLPVPAFEPYFADLLNVQVARADLGFDGDVHAKLGEAGPEVKLGGNLSVNDGRLDSAAPEAPATAPNPASARIPSASATVSRARARPAGGAQRGALKAGSARARTLFSWRTLALKDLAVAIAPGTAARASVGSTTLADFFVRIAVDPSGRINLQDLVRSDNANAPEKEAVSAGEESARAPKDAQNAQSAASSAGPAGKRSASRAELQFGPTTFTHGRVQFTDNFVKPSYSASLSDLDGTLGAFGNSGNSGAAASERAKVSLAPLELHGKAEGSASLDITGSLNPLADPLALDISAKVRNLELPPLSPYSVKYAGHGIERGKLDMNVHYQIEPDGHLTATNSLVLRQLVFGEAVDGAKSLPVKLATALLADSNGVIDLDIPISGSLNDPQFSLAPVIGKAILNILVRAVTAPFSLISSALRGATHNSEGATIIAFADGSARLDAADQETLAKVAAAMKEHPAIDMTIVGHASLAAEAAGYRRQRLDRLLAFTKRRELLAAGKAPAAPGGGAGPSDLPTVSAEEYPALLADLYDRTDMRKPRNALGFARKLPVPEMEQLLLAQIDVTPQAIRELAVQRAGAVRDALAQAGVPESRLFLGLPEVAQEAAAPAATDPADGSAGQDGPARAGSAGDGKADKPLAPGRVELRLATH